MSAFGGGTALVAALSADQGIALTTPAVNPGRPLLAGEPDIDPAGVFVPIAARPGTPPASPNGSA